MKARTTTRWMVTAASMMVAVLVGQMAAAALIDFETTPSGVTPVDDAPLPSGTPYNFPGLQVSFGFDLDSNGSIDSDGLFELVGSSGTDTIGGFQGSNGQDTADAGFGAQLGNWFLKSPMPGSPFGRFVIQYTSSFPVTAASGEIWDIDGQPQNSTTEEYTVQAFDSSSTLIATIVSPLGVLDTFSAPLDGQPWVFAFSGLSAGIDHIVITFTGTKPAGIGLAFNNFNPTAVPEPSAAALSMLGMPLLGVWRVRRRRRCGEARPTCRNGRSCPSRCLVTCILAFAVLSAASARAATVVFDNLDPAPSPFLYSLGGSWSGNFSPSLYATTSTTFVPSASGQLDELELGFTHQNIAGSNAATLTLYDDIAGLPGTQLWQSNVTVPSVFGQLTQVFGISGPTLHAGQTYWLAAAAPTDGITLHGWYSNNQGDNGPVISSGTYFATAVRYSLRVGVKMIPEPTSVIPLVSGAVLVFASVRRRNSARYSTLRVTPVLRP